MRPAASPGDRRRAPRRARRSRPGSGRSPPGRRGCPRCARSTARLADPGSRPRPAAPRAAPRRSRAAADRSGAGCSRSCCPSRAGTRGGSSPGAEYAPSAGSPQAVEQRLGLGVDPVQILEHQQQRLHLALAKQQALEGVEGPLAPLRRVERLPRGVVDRDVEQRQSGGRSGSSARSSVSSLPVTFSRIARASSRASI